MGLLIKKYLELESNWNENEKKIADTNLNNNLVN